MQEEAADFALILETLTRHNVNFIVVGGVCAVLLGAPVSTFDLDIVHDRNSLNVARLHNALSELNTHYREHLPNLITPSPENLKSSGHHLLLTNHGPLDVLGTIGINDDYQALVSKTETISIGDGTTINILNLDTLIEVKTKTARAKDKPMLEILNAIKQQE